jgi:hypothetical protein
MHQPALDDQQRPQGQEAQVPGERGTEVVAHVVHAQDVVVDDPLDEVEDAPAGQHEPSARVFTSRPASEVMG